jgi:hypothetical protein
MRVFKGNAIVYRKADGNIGVICSEDLGPDLQELITDSFEGLIVHVGPEVPELNTTLDGSLDNPDASAEAFCRVLVNLDEMLDDCALNLNDIADMLMTTGAQAVIDAIRSGELTFEDIKAGS